MQRFTLVLLMHFFVFIASSNPLRGDEPTGNTIAPATPAELIDAIRAIMDETQAVLLVYLLYWGIIGVRTWACSGMRVVTQFSEEIIEGPPFTA